MAAMRGIGAPNRRRSHEACPNRTLSATSEALTPESTVIRLIVSSTSPPLSDAPT